MVGGGSRRHLRPLIYQASSSGEGSPPHSSPQWRKARRMPVVQCSWAELEATVTSLEKGRHEVIQVIESPKGVAIVYRKSSKVETR